MKEFWKRLWKRGIVVALILAAVGFGLGELFLMVSSTFSRDVDQSLNQHVLWQTPIRMAISGLILLTVLELISQFVFKKHKSKKAEGLITEKENPSQLMIQQ